jgi:maltose/moltooligosaccharide transporter
LPHFRVLVFQIFDNEPIYALLIGGASMILAGIIALTINDESKNYNK